MSTLVRLSEKPQQNEEWLVDTWRDLGGLIQRRNNGLKDLVSRDWERILHWVASSNCKPVQKTPMNVYSKLKTVDEYALYWQRFICFYLWILDENVEEIAGFKFTEE